MTGISGKAIKEGSFELQKEEILVIAVVIVVIIVVIVVIIEQLE